MAWGKIKDYRRDPLPCAGALEAEHQKARVTTEDTVVTATDQTSEKAAPQEEEIAAGE